MSDKQNENADGSQWFLRTGGESIFGPVSTQGLIVWAEQGRILPGHEVSNDRKKWIQAISVDVLDMRWFVDDGEGELRGPLNRLAAEALIKSGKVPAGAQIVSADDVETAAEAVKEPAPTAEKVLSQVPQDALLDRVRELESLVTGQRERIAKLANADAMETLQRERDALASLVKELEAQRDTILRNAEKDSRASERKQEQLRQQIRKMEQQLEEANSRQLLNDQTAAAAEKAQPAMAERELAFEQERREAAERISQLTRASDVARERLASAERQLLESRAAAEAVQVASEQEGDALRSRVSALEQAVLFHEKRSAEMQQILDVREAELAAERLRVAECERRLAAAEIDVSAAERKASESEAAFAELLNDANARDNAYAEKVAALEKVCAQPAEETARFYSDQAAVYELAKAEAEELSKTLELERNSFERLKEWSVQRQQTLAERRQTLMRRLGDSPVEMTRRSLREQPSDPNVARLRTELDTLRIAHQRELRKAEETERDLQRKLRVFEAESTKLQGQAAEGEKVGRRLQELSEQLRKREQELTDERKNREAEREQFQGSQQALLMRIDLLEKASRSGTPDEIQSAEARNVKIATWMRLRK